MLFTLERLFRPFIYIKIRHNAKTIYDFIIPLMLTILTTIIYYFLPSKPSLFGSNGCITYISEILKFLSPFYIASLAAIATFQSKTLEEKTQGNPLTVTTKTYGNKCTHVLNRRQFLSLLFGYLSLLSLFLYFSAYIASVLAINFSFLSYFYYQLIKYLFILIYYFWFFNLITTTMLGLYYLSIKLHSTFD